MKSFSLVVSCIGVFFTSFLSAATPGSFWEEPYQYPVHNPFSVALDDYYPCVIFDKNSFEGHGDLALYKMWHQGENGIAVSISDDGIHWVLKSIAVILGEAVHPCVVYNKDGFSDGNYFYKMWFWTGTVGSSIDVIQYAYSVDGINWTPPQPITQDLAKPLVDGLTGSYFFHSYGPGFVTYNPNALINLDQPYTYPYLMLFDTASEGFTSEGSIQQIGLAYSSDGIMWKRYLDAPVFAPSGNSNDWDGLYAFRASLIRDGDMFHLFYSGSNGDSSKGVAQAHGIGHALSSDGVYWVRDSSNPLFICSDGPVWRNSRTLTPFVLLDSFECKHPSFKMWFTGGAGNTIGQNQGIGYATSPNPRAVTNPENAPCPPRNFKGKVKKTKLPDNSTKYDLFAKWKPSFSSNVIFYKIYRNATVVKIVPSTKRLCFKISVTSKCSWLKYSISAVNCLGIESSRVPLMKK